MTKTLALLATLFFSSLSQACLVNWVNGQTNYWPTQQIEVCFQIPNPRFSDFDLTLYNRAKRIITETYQKLNSEMPYQFWGFQNCTEDNRPRFAIQIFASSGLGRADSVGPASANVVPNLMLTSAVLVKNESVPQPILEKNLQILVMHESMHLLGMHHENSRLNTKLMSHPDSTMVPVGPYDEDSVMSFKVERAFLDKNELVPGIFPFLSVEDKNCVEFMYSRPANITPYLE